MNKSFLITLLLVFGLCGCTWPKDEWEYTMKRDQMVQQQIAKRGITDERVLTAMRNVKRHLFVPERSWDIAYNDHPVSIGYDQTISQPFIVAYMTEAVRLKSDDKVLEIGTGSGYQTAILAEVVDEVYSIEIVEPLADSAAERLKEFGYQNIFVKHGDGYQGWKEHSPYDVIIVTAAPETIPPKLIEQLNVGGRMVIPVGSFSQELVLVIKTEEGIQRKRLLPVRFVPMVEKDTQ